MTFLQARTANEVLKARLGRMELQQKEDELVDRARAVEWFLSCSHSVGRTMSRKEATRRFTVEDPTRRRP
jgi:hypothetical protein